MAAWSRLRRGEPRCCCRSAPTQLLLSACRHLQKHKDCQWLGQGPRGAMDGAAGGAGLHLLQHGWSAARPEVDGPSAPLAAAAAAGGSTRGMVA